MSYSQTPNYSLYKPTINSDNDQWGTHLNANADTLDTALKTIANTAGVVSWNTRTGVVTLNNADVTTVLPPSSTTPSMDGTAAVGTGTTWARSDHIHPSDTSRYAATNPSGYQTAAQVTTAVAPALNNVGRNLIHNPLFNVAQRGAGPFNYALPGTSFGYTADRWQGATAATGDTLSVSIVAASDANRASVGDEASEWLFNCSVTGGAAAGNAVLATQPIEDVRRLAGKTVTVSFYANSGTANYKVGVSLDQNFGTGGSPSAGVNGNGQAVTLSSTVAQFQRYSLTFAVPSAAGKTLGSSGNSATGLNFWFSSGTTNATRSGNVGVQSGTINLWGVQLEIGSVATPLEKPDPRYDLANCQRFYVGNLQVVCGGYSAAALTASTSIGFPVTMRATPTVGTISNADVVLTSPGNTPLSDRMLYLSGLTPSGATGWTMNRTLTLSADL